MSAATPSSPLLFPRGRDTRQASGHFGCSPGKFKKIVRLGIAWAMRHGAV
jgi:hypothetical protein